MGKEEIARELAERIKEFKPWEEEEMDAFAREVISEIDASAYRGGEEFLNNLLSSPRAEVKMGEFGVGSRGEGDFFVHHKISEVVGKTGAEVDPAQQDDAGVVKGGEHYIAVAVDGIHSRLSDYPFLAGFHAARAALRDIYVMGSRPLALATDIHLGDDGDIGRLLDFTAGVSLAGELTSTPLVGGSTLRIGGDMVFGERLTGGVGAVGTSSRRPKARKEAEAGDAILVAQGAGGGTVSTIAIYNRYHQIVKETLNVEFMEACERLMNSPEFENIHSLTDVTNGGLRGDAREIAATARKKLVFYEEGLESTVNPGVRNMLKELGIDYLGISTDSLMVIAPRELKDSILKTLEGVANVYEVGRVEEGTGAYIESQGELRDFSPLFREASYTNVKKFLGEGYPEGYKRMKDRMERAKDSALEKKEEVRNFILRRNEDGKGNL